MRTYILSLYAAHYRNTKEKALSYMLFKYNHLTDLYRIHLR